MRGIVAATVLVAVLLIAACTSDMRVVTSGLRPVPVIDTSARTVHERQGESHRSRQMRFLGYSRDGETGFKEHLVGWGGPGTDPRKVVVPFPVVVHDGRWVAYKNQRESPANR